MEDLGKSIPAAEIIAETEVSAGRVIHNEFCLNCGAKLVSKYCADCGQKDIPRRQTLGELWMNFISSFWSYEGKFWSTIIYLVTKPGFLAWEYNQGRRERHFHPARMYVFISFIFFLILALLPEGKNTTPTGGSDSTRQATYTYQGTGLQLALTPNYKSVAAYDSAQQVLPAAARDGWFSHMTTQREIEIAEKYTKEEFAEIFGATFTENVSKIFFFLLPVFALLLKLLYIRKDYFYSEHLVFSIYLYNFFFFAASVFMLIGLIPGFDGLAQLLLLVLLVWYFIVALHKNYQQSWPMTTLKFFIFTFTFVLCIAAGMFVNLFVTMMLI